MRYRKKRGALFIFAQERVRFEVFIGKKKHDGSRFCAAKRESCFTTPARERMEKASERMEICLIHSLPKEEERFEELISCD